MKRKVIELLEDFGLISWGRFNTTIIPLALVAYEMVIATSALRTSLAVYHLIYQTRVRGIIVNYTMLS